MLADDSLINQKVALNQLRSLGYEADVVANGEEVLDLMTKISYDIIFMDGQMPVLDGYATTQAIRQREGETRHTIVIATTANAMKGDREQCLAAGMDDYLSKPVRKEDLAAKLLYWSQILIASSSQLHRPPAPSAVERDPDSEVPSQLSESTDELINWSYLEQVSGGNKDFEQELLQAFVQMMIPRIQSLKAAVVNQDFQQVERIAHNIKGSSTSSGILTLEAVTSELEKQGRSQTLNQADRLLTELEVEFERVQALISHSFS